MRVKDAFDVLEQGKPPIGVTLERVKSTLLHLKFTLPRDTRTELDVFGLPILLGSIGAVGTIFLFLAGLGLFSIILLVSGVPYLVKMVHRLHQERLYTALLLSLSAKGGEVYRVGHQVKKKLEAYYRWGELKAVSVKEVPKSKEDFPPYYIHLEAKGSDIRLFEGSLSADSISYTASMIEALLDQRYRGAVPTDWMRSLEVLGEPLRVDWSEHLIDDEL
ncbi:MAG: hypothetical protein ACRBFS_25755 [Aureispira sp.]